MKKIAIAFCISLSLFTSKNISAQRCISMEYLQQQLQNDPDMAQRIQDIETQTAQFITNYNGGGSRAIITIPVVVHVVYNTTAQNVSTAQIQSQIDRLNLDFRKLNSDWTNTPSVWQSLVADYEIEFCLATRDPNGNTTTGIIRKQTSSSSFSTNDNVKYTANGGDDAWPRASYLNIWVCNISGGVLGYAQFPGGAAATDGVVIDYTCFGDQVGTAQAPYDMGRTATHEVGHWLNLYHIWGDDGSSCSGSDNVGDTPNQGSEHYGCPSFPSVSCSNGPNGDMWMNYMDYTDDECMFMFTSGQKTRSLALFNTGGARYSLLSSLGCQSLASPPLANFSASPLSSCTGVVQFSDLSTNNPTSWNWNFGDGTTSSAQSPSHTYTTNGTYTIVLTAANQFGSNVKTLTNYITISKPAAPSANDVSHCGSGTFSLSTTSTNPVAWLDSNGTKVSSSNPFVTPVLTQTTTYWLQDTVGGTQYHVGKVDNSGSGGNLNSNWALVFNVNTSCTLQSVYVYANGAGNRTFEWRSSTGSVIQSTTVYCANGGSRVNLNFNLVPGTGYLLGLQSGSNINLYRNNAGAMYPYNDVGGFISITGNNATNAAAYYYYCYDWIIQGTSCVSQQKAVTAIVSAGLAANTSVTDASCGANNGSASVSISGGVPNYSYYWSNGGNSSSISNLSAGTYTVTVNDANSCSGTASAVVSSVSNLTSSKNSTNVTCFGGSNGTASVTVISGTPNYSFDWSNNANTSSVSNLAAGNFTVTITDGNNCVHIDSFTITEPAPIAVQITTGDVQCHGQSNGTASTSATGGNFNFTFYWSNSQTGTGIVNLTAGNYSITATDALNCTSSATFTINEPAAILINATSTNISCFGDNNGTANAIPSGGIGNFTYNWCNGNTAHNASGLSAGNCTVTVTDDNACTATASVTINEPSQIQIQISSTNGNAQVDTIYGGIAPFYYLWSNGATAQSISNLSPGNYLVTVTDNNGCTAVTGINVEGANSINVPANRILFEVYPNPAHDEAELVLGQWNENASFSLKNVLGQTLLTKNILSLKTKIDCTPFPGGIYLLEVKQGGKTTMKQIVVNK